MFIFLYVIFFSIWALQNYKQYGLNISVLIILIYLVGAINGCCIYLFYPLEIKFPERITFNSVSAHILLLWLFMYPLVRYGNSLKVNNLIIKEYRLRVYSWFVIIPSLLCILASSSDIFKVFAYGDLSAAREAYVTGDISSQYVKNFGPVGYIMCLGPSISFLSLFLFCYYKFYLKKNGLLVNLLFIGSFGIVINNLAIAGREGFIRWIFYSIACFVFFRKYIIFKRFKKLFIGIGIFAAIMLIIFARITLDRFEDSTYGPLYSILSYSGQQFYYFSYGFDRFANEGYGALGKLFPLITNERAEAFNINSFVSADFYLNTFSTFVGSFIKEGGFENTLFLAIGAFIFLLLTFWKKYKFVKYSLPILIGYLFYYEIIMMGFFYFLHYLRFTQLTILFYIVLAFFIGRTTLRSSKNTPI